MIGPALTVRWTDQTVDDPATAVDYIDQRDPDAARLGEVFINGEASQPCRVDSETADCCSVATG